MNLSDEAADDLEAICKFVRENRKSDPRRAVFGTLSEAGAIELSVRGILKAHGMGGKQWKLTDSGATFVYDRINEEP